MSNQTSNPAGVSKITDLTPPPSGAASVQPPSAAVVGKQDPHHTERDFMRDLDSATQRLDRPS